MKKLFLVILCAVISLAAWADSAFTEASRLETSGDFKAAETVLKSALTSSNLAAADRSELAFQLDVIHRIRLDYSLTREDFFHELTGSMKEVTREEFEHWIKLGWFDERTIDGELRFFNSSLSNLYFRHPELEARRIHPKNPGPGERQMLDNIEAIERAAAETKSTYVMPQRLHVTMRVMAAENTAPAGEAITAWLPIPRHYPFQTDFKLVSTSAKPLEIAGENSPIRSIALTERAVSNHPTEFEVEYEYTARAVHFDLHPEDIKPFDTSDPEYKKFTSEAPHVVFTPGIKALSEKIIGGETNALLKARKIYNWLTENLRYSYALEYSTLTNISDYTRSHGYGDCGQQSLLFITLCRYNGVPARWQSGWYLFPGDTGIHDWAEIYLAPGGWMPVDTSMGTHAMREITTLTPAQKTEIRDFFFGGLDQYRMIANSDHNQTLEPAKKSFRSDNVDFQRGELDHAGQNIYFDRFKFNLSYTVVANPSLP